MAFFVGGLRDWKLILHWLGREEGFLLVVVDERSEVAKIRGIKEICSRSIFHALNQKAPARIYANDIGEKYENLNLVVAHMGGGISVAAHRKGEVVDVNVIKNSYTVLIDGEKKEVINNGKSEE